jgi:uncharacterized membrane protein YtjA (UPF0391 family)
MDVLVALVAGIAGTIATAALIMFAIGVISEFLNTLVAAFERKNDD